MAELRVRCPGCQAVLKLKSEPIGKSALPCPKCKTNIPLGGAAKAAPSGELPTRRPAPSSEGAPQPKNAAVEGPKKPAPAARKSQEQTKAAPPPSQLSPPPAPLPSPETPDDEYGLAEEPVPQSAAAAKAPRSKEANQSPNAPPPRRRAKRSSTNSARSTTVKMVVAGVVGVVVVAAGFFAGDALGARHAAAAKLRIVYVYEDPPKQPSAAPTAPEPSPPPVEAEPADRAPNPTAATPAADLNLAGATDQSAAATSVVASSANSPGVPAPIVASAIPGASPASAVDDSRPLIPAPEGSGNLVESSTEGDQGIAWLSGRTYVYAIDLMTKHQNNVEQINARVAYQRLPDPPPDPNRPVSVQSAKAFFIHPQGYLAASAGIVKKGTRVEVDYGDKRYFARVCGVDEAGGVALLQIAASDCPSFSLAPSKALELDATAFQVTLGSDMSAEPQLSMGKVSGVLLRNGRKQLQMETTSPWTESGAPIFAKTGAIIGISGSAPSIEKSPIFYSADGIITLLNGQQIEAAPGSGPTGIKETANAVRKATAAIRVYSTADSETTLPKLRYVGDYWYRGPEGKSRRELIKGEVELRPDGSAKKYTGGSLLPPPYSDLAVMVLDPLVPASGSEWSAPIHRPGEYPLPPDAKAQFKLKSKDSKIAKVQKEASWVSGEGMMRRENKGEGLIEFDQRLGVPVSGKFANTETIVTGKIALETRWQLVNVEPLLAEMKNPLAPSREFADSYIDALLAGLKSIDLGNVNACLIAIYDIKPIISRQKDIVKAVGSFRTHKDRDTARRATLALQKWATKDEVSVLVAMLRDNDSSVRSGALQALGRIKDPTSVKAVVLKLTEDPDRSEAKQALEAMGPVAEAGVLTALASKDPQVRRDAVYILSKVGAAQSVDPLNKLVFDVDTEVSQAAKAALEAIAQRGK